MTGPVELTDEQIESWLDASTKWVYVWRMSRANGNDKARRNSLAKIRALLTDPVDEPARQHEQYVAQARAEYEKMRAKWAAEEETP